jgi:hypothetical protein
MRQRRLLLAVWGGEYGTADWLPFAANSPMSGPGRRAPRRVRLVGLLATISKPIRSQERVAREQFGMIRDGEVLYRVVPR